MLLLCFFQLLATEYLSARCFSDQYLGLWTFSIAKGRYLKNNDHVACNPKTSLPSRLTTLNVTLLDNGVAQSQGGYAGRWTPIDNHGFELRIATDVFYVVSSFNAELHNDTHYKVDSRCNEVHFGWRTTQGIQPSSFYCLTGSLVRPLINYDVTTHYVQRDLSSKLIEPPFLSFKQNLSSTNTSARGTKIVPFANASSWNLQLGDPPPGAWSWGDVGGVSFLPAAAPAPAGRGCNSSYVEAALAAMTARVMVASNRTDPLGRDAFLSAQHVLDCSQYGQGCAGGYFEEVGLFAETYGILTVDAYPSRPGDNVRYCSPSNPTSDRYFFTNYYPIGGYLGAVTSPLEIMWEIYRNGPVVAGIKPNADWYSCSPTTEEVFLPSYYPTTTTGIPNRRYFYTDVSYGVVIIGWGTDDTIGDYWLVLDPFSARTSSCQSNIRKVARGVNAFNIESYVGGSNWVPLPDLLATHPNKLVIQRTFLVCLFIADIVSAIFSILSVVLLCSVIRKRRLLSVSNSSFLMIPDTAL